MLSAVTSSEAILCSAVKPNCTADVECARLQATYGAVCFTALFGSPVGDCSPACKDVYFQLVGNAIGKQYHGCDCGNDDTCVQQNLLNNCFKGVLPPLREPCNTSDVISACSPDPTCGPLLSTYQTECGFAFQGTNCSQQCKQSFMDILRNRLGNRFTVCGCGNDTVCQGFAQNLGNTCFNGTYPSVKPEPIPTVAPGCSSVGEIGYACSQEPVCAHLQFVYTYECRFAFGGVNCSQKCQQAFLTLLQNPIVNRFNSCGCGSDKECHTAFKNLATTCFNGTIPKLGVQQEIIPTFTSGCSSADVSTACSISPTCGPLLSVYLSECTFAFEGVKCSQQCKQAVINLFESPIGKSYNVCGCGDDISCKVGAYNLGRTCYNGTFPYIQPNIQLDPSGCNFKDHVGDACSQDPTCAPILSVYTIECKFAFGGLSCSQQCKQALIALLQNPIGNRFYVCGCGTDIGCHTTIQNLGNTCFNGEFPSIQPVPIPTLASGCNFQDVGDACSQNLACAPLLSVYTTECKFAFDGLNCSQLCKQSLIDLLQNPIGNRFSVCGCGNDMGCHTTIQNLGNTCFNGTFPTVQLSSTDQVDDVDYGTTAPPKNKAANVNVQIVLTFAFVGFLLLVT